MKKTIALLIAIVFVLSAFAGCANNTGKTEGTTNPPATTPETTPDTPVTPAVNVKTWVSEGYRPLYGKE